MCVRNYLQFNKMSRNEIFNNVACATSNAHMRSLIRALVDSMGVKLQTEHHSEFLSLKGDLQRLV